MPIVNTNIAETINITENGQHDVAKYTTANVSVAGVPRTVDANGVLQMPTTLPDLNDFLGGATDVGDYAFYNAFYPNISGYVSPLTGNVNLSSLTTISGDRACYQMFRSCTGITSVDLSNLTTVVSTGCYNMFSGCTGITGALDLSSLTTISGTNACYGMFNGCTGITSVNLSNLTTVSASGGCYNMFSGCTGLTSVDLSSLTTTSDNGLYKMFSGCTGLTGSINLSNLTIGGGSYVFENCTGITSVDLSSLTTIIGAFSSMFSGCTSLTSVDLSSLTTLDAACSSMFSGCTNLTSVDLSSLSSLTKASSFQNAFRNCTSLTTLSFPALNTTSFGSQYVNQFGGMLSGVTGCTLHFPSNLDPQGGSTVISGLTGYPNFSGTNTIVLFDLPATE